MNDYASSEARLHFHRRDLLVAMAALPFVAAACQSGARTETVAKIQEATKGHLAELATSPEEAERLLAVYDRMGASATKRSRRWK